MLFSAVTDNSRLLFYALAAVLGLVVLVARFKVNSFVALILASVFVGLCSGMSLADLGKGFQDGVGKILGDIAMIVGLGTLLGKLLAESGGAEVVAHTLIGGLGQARLAWAMLFVAFVVGIPVWFTVGLVLLVPILFTIAKETGTPLLRLGIPLAAGLSITHGLVPPHPGPMVAIGALHANVGATIFYSVLIGLPTAVLAGPLCAGWLGRGQRVDLSGGVAAQMVPDRPRENLPGFGLTVFTILLPVMLMLLATVVDVAFSTDTLTIESVAPDKRSAVAAELQAIQRGVEKDTALKLLEAVPVTVLAGATRASAETAMKKLETAGAAVVLRRSRWQEWIELAGHPLVAMTLAFLFSCYSFGFARGLGREQILKFTNDCVGPVASTLLIVGAGGGFNRVLVLSGVGDAIAALVKGWPVSPLVLGWLVAALIRLATGSATVAITTAAGILAPVAAAAPGTNLELLVIAMGAGSLILSHVNDGGFWFVKEYFNLSLTQTLKTWTVMETIISVVALLLALLLNRIV